MTRYWGQPYEGSDDEANDIIRAEREAREKESKKAERKKKKKK